MLLAYILRDCFVGMEGKMQGEEERQCVVGGVKSCWVRDCDVTQSSDIKPQWAAIRLWLCGAHNLIG